MPNSPPIVLDATILSNFASTSSSYLLDDVFQNPITAVAVEREIYSGIQNGYAFLQDAADECGNTIPVEAPSNSVPQNLQARLDWGEAQALHIANERNGTFVSDDRDARQYADIMKVPTTGSIGVLARGVDQGEISIQTADQWLNTWCTQYGYHSPVSSLAQYLSSP